MKISAVDLFCGAGGLTNGLIKAGIPVKAGVDFEEFCRAAYNTNNPGAIFYNRDISKLDKAEVLSWFGDAEIKILAGCAPCQPFSNYTNWYDTTKTKKYSLLDHFGRLIKETNPDIIIMENVPNVVRHKPFLNFVDNLWDNHFHVSYDVLDFSQFGLPQKRKRTVLLASRLGRIRIPTTPAKPQIKTVRQTIEHVPPLQESKDPLHVAAKLTEINLQRIQASKPGGSWEDWPENLKLNCHLKESGKSYTSVYARMEWDKPSPTITTQFVGFGNGRFGHPEQDRALSLREGALLQSFPTDYKFAEPSEFSMTKIARLIGIAVPPLIGKILGEAILEHLKHPKDNLFETLF